MRERKREKERERERESFTSFLLYSLSQESIIIEEEREYCKFNAE